MQQVELGNTEKELSRLLTEVAQQVHAKAAELSNLDAAAPRSASKELDDDLVEKLRVYKSLLLDLKHVAEEQDLPEQTRLVEACVAHHQRALEEARNAVQRARLQSKINYGKLYEQKRRELIGSVDYSQRQQKFAREQDVVDGSQDITASLKRTRQLMMQSLEQTHGNISVLSASNKRLLAAGDELAGHKALFKDTRKHQHTLQKQSWMDRWGMYLGFAFFLLCVGYVSLRRTPAFIKQPVYAMLHMKSGGEPFTHEDYATVKVPPGAFVPTEHTWGGGRRKLPPEWEAWDSNFEGDSGPMGASGAFADAEWLDAEQHEPVGRTGAQVWRRGQHGELLQEDGSRTGPPTPRQQHEHRPGSHQQQQPGYGGQHEGHGVESGECSAAGHAPSECSGAPHGQQHPGQHGQAAGSPPGEQEDFDQGPDYFEDAAEYGGAEGGPHDAWGMDDGSLPPTPEDWSAAAVHQQQQPAPTAAGIVDPDAAAAADAQRQPGAEGAEGADEDPDELEYWKQLQEAEQEAAHHEGSGLEGQPAAAAEPQQQQVLQEVSSPAVHEGDGAHGRPHEQVAAAQEPAAPQQATEQGPSQGPAAAGEQRHELHQEPGVAAEAAQQPAASHPGGAVVDDAQWEPVGQEQEQQQQGLGSHPEPVDGSHQQPAQDVRQFEEPLLQQPPPAHGQVQHVHQHGDSASQEAAPTVDDAHAAQPEQQQQQQQQQDMQAQDASQAELWPQQQGQGEGEMPVKETPAVAVDDAVPATEVSPSVAAQQQAAEPLQQDLQQQQHQELSPGQQYHEQPLGHHEQAAAQEHLQAAAHAPEATLQQQQEGPGDEVPPPQAAPHTETESAAPHMDVEQAAEDIAQDAQQAAAASQQAVEDQAAALEAAASDEWLPGTQPTEPQEAPAAVDAVAAQPREPVDAAMHPAASEVVPPAPQPSDGGFEQQGPEEGHAADGKPEADPGHAGMGHVQRGETDGSMQPAEHIAPTQDVAVGDHAADDSGAQHSTPSEHDDQQQDHQEQPWQEQPEAQHQQQQSDMKVLSQQAEQQHEDELGDAPAVAAEPQQQVDVSQEPAHEQEQRHELPQHEQQAQAAPAAAHPAPAQVQEEQPAYMAEHLARLEQQEAAQQQQQHGGEWQQEAAQQHGDEGQQDGAVDGGVQEDLQRLHHQAPADSSQQEAQLTQQGKEPAADDAKPEADFAGELHTRMQHEPQHTLQQQQQQQAEAREQQVGTPAPEQDAAAVPPQHQEAAQQAAAAPPAEAEQHRPAAVPEEVPAVTGQQWSYSHEAAHEAASAPASDGSHTGDDADGAAAGGQDAGADLQADDAVVEEPAAGATPEAALASDSTHQEPHGLQEQQQEQVQHQEQQQELHQQELDLAWEAGMPAEHHPTQHEGAAELAGEEVSQQQQGAELHAETPEQPQAQAPPPAEHHPPQQLADGVADDGAGAVAAPDDDSSPQDHDSEAVSSDLVQPHQQQHKLWQQQQQQEAAPQETQAAAAPAAPAADLSSDLDASAADLVQAGLKQKMSAVAAQLKKHGASVEDPDAPAFELPPPPAAVEEEGAQEGASGRLGLSGWLSGWMSQWPGPRVAAASELKLELRPLEGAEHFFDDPYSDYYFAYDDPEGGQGGAKGGRRSAVHVRPGSAAAAKQHEWTYLDPEDNTDEQDYDEVTAEVQAGAVAGRVGQGQQGTQQGGDAAGRRRQQAPGGTAGQG